MTEHNAIVKADKCHHKGMLHGHISNGGGEIDMGNGYALRFVAHNDMFVCLQLLDYGTGIKVKNQIWQKSKMVKPKSTKPTLPEIKKNKTVDL